MAVAVRLAPPASGQDVYAHCRRGGGFMASPMRTISLPSGDQIPVLGQGTWGLGPALPRQPAAAEHGLDRSVPTALARAGAAGRDPRSLPRPAERRPDQE